MIKVGLYELVQEIAIIMHHRYWPYLVYLLTYDTYITHLKNIVKSWKYFMKFY